MSPEQKLAFQQKLHDLHINSSMGIDEKNIYKITLLADELFLLCQKLYLEFYPEENSLEGENKKVVASFSLEENDVTEATEELSFKARPHRPEVKPISGDGIALKSMPHPHKPESK